MTLKPGQWFALCFTDSAAMTSHNIRYVHWYWLSWIFICLFKPRAASFWRIENIFDWHGLERLPDSQPQVLMLKATIQPSSAATGVCWYGSLLNEYHSSLLVVLWWSLFRTFFFQLFVGSAKRFISSLTLLDCPAPISTVTSIRLQVKVILDLLWGLIKSR